MSHKKCWYCETPMGRSFFDVDHFRPKYSPNGESEHLGYWWLAYNPYNYRLSCEFCNRIHDKKNVGSEFNIGKGTQFPIFGERQGTFNIETHKEKGPLGFFEALHESIKDEKHVLLDPLKEDDVILIRWDNSGLIIPNTKDKLPKERVETTKNILDLDQPILAQSRRKVYEDVGLLVEDYALAIKSLTKPSNDLVLIERVLKRSSNCLNKMLEKEAPYLSVAEESMREQIVGNKLFVLLFPIVIKEFFKMDIDWNLTPQEIATQMCKLASKFSEHLDL